MNDKKFDVVVIGGGPAGYPAAIRAAQLGLSAVCIDDWKNEEGTAPLRRHVLERRLHPVEGAARVVGALSPRAFGVPGARHQVDRLSIDVETMQTRKRGIVKQLTSGIEAMFKAGGVVGIKGRGKLLAGNRVEVTTDTGVEMLAAEHVVLATGSTPIELPIAKFDGKRIVDSTGALEFTTCRSASASSARASSVSSSAPSGGGSAPRS